MEGLYPEIEGDLDPAAARLLLAVAIGVWIFLDVVTWLFQKQEGLD